MKQNMTSIVNPKYVQEVQNPSLFKYKHSRKCRSVLSGIKHIMKTAPKTKVKVKHLRTTGLLTVTCSRVNHLHYQLLCCLCVCGVYACSKQTFHVAV